MSIFGNDAPETTGSLAPPVDVQRPLPETLAYSDATKIGQAANMTLLQANGAGAEEWVNATTGSSGTVHAAALDAASQPGDCRPFSTIVTSIGGVHQYSGAICQTGGGPPRVQIDERSPDDRV